MSEKTLGQRMDEQDYFGRSFLPDNKEGVYHINGVFLAPDKKGFLMDVCVYSFDHPNKPYVLSLRFRQIPFLEIPQELYDYRETGLFSKKMQEESKSA